MIMIWNRKEVFVGTSMGKFSATRDILASNNVKYTYKVVNRNNSAFFGSKGSHMGTFNESIDYANEYYVYVHKDDYENAYRMLHKN